jgi:hypothetical protein
MRIMGRCGQICLPVGLLFQWASTIKIQLSVLVQCKEEIIRIKRHTFSPLFLFCSVLKNFKIFTPLLPHFSYGTLLMTDITYVLESMCLYCQCITECNYFNNSARKVPKTFPIDTCPSLNEIMIIRCIKCTWREQLYDF